MKFYLNYVKITKEEATKLISAKQLREAKQCYIEEPELEIAVMISKGLLAIEF